MTPTLRQRIWKTTRWFIAIFFLMLIFRLIYGYVGLAITLFILLVAIDKLKVMNKLNE